VTRFSQRYVPPRINRRQHKSAWHDKDQKNPDTTGGNPRPAHQSILRHVVTSLTSQQFFYST